MKRVVINALSVDDGVSGHMWRVVYGTESHEFFLIGKSVVSEVEDVSDPLPTEPGVRFWGKTDESEPQWWFVQDLGGGSLCYCASSYEHGIDHDVALGNVERYGLVHLPDPEESLRRCTTCGLPIDKPGCSVGPDGPCHTLHRGVYANPEATS